MADFIATGANETFTGTAADTNDHVSYANAGTGVKVNLSVSGR